MYFRKMFWKETAERVISTMAQAALAAMGATGMVQGVDWTIVGGTTVFAGLASFLKCLAAQKFNDPDTPSLVNVD